MTSKPAKLNRRSEIATPDSRGVHVLVSVTQMVAGTLERDAVLDAAMDAAAEAMNAEACSILLNDPVTGELCFHLVKGERTDGLDSARICVDDDSIAGWVAAHQEPLLIPDAYDDARFNPAYDKKTGFHTQSVICVPLVAKEKELGVIQVLNRRDGESFDADDLELCQAVASLIAVAIHNAEEHAARLQAERVAVVGQTIAGLAHCIKNILNGLNGGSYIIDQNLGKGDPERAKRGWAMVKRNMGLLSNIVLDMLSYTKSRKPALNPTPVNRLCEDIVALLEGQAREGNVTLAAQLSDDIDEVDVDEAALKRSLINLVGNAIDASKEKQGTVTLETALENGSDRFTLTVRDTGCGMPPEVVEKIFNPFFSTKGNKGTGLGLAVTKKIVEEHSGVLEVESTLGEGTAFIITLPVRQKQA